MAVDMREHELHPNTVEVINNLVAPTLPRGRVRELDRLAASYIEGLNQYDQLFTDRSDFLAPLTEAVASAEDGSELAELAILEGRGLIERSQKSPTLIQFRFLQRLHAANSSDLTLWMKALRAVIKVPADPLAPAIEHREQSQLAVSGAKLDRDSKMSSYDVILQTQLGLADNRLSRDRNRLTIIWESQVVDSDELLGQYVILRPGRIDDCVAIFAENHYLDADRRVWFPGFEKGFKQAVYPVIPTRNYIESGWKKHIADEKKQQLLAQLETRFTLLESTPAS